MHLGEVWTGWPFRLGEPQRGCGLQPRVAASATLGMRFVESLPQRGCSASLNDATALRLNGISSVIPG